MGIYLNPGNSGFAEISNGDYVDKTGLISLTNHTINTKQKLTCVSRPRRFGKSYAAQMLCAYYDKTCDSAELFEDLEIAQDQSYAAHLNKYDVIYLDMTNIMGEAGNQSVISYIRERIAEELKMEYPALKIEKSFSATLINAAEHTYSKFIMIIDEWDAPIREMPDIEKEYLKFLRTLFKGSGTTAKIFAAAYMTGILPIKKDGSQPAISNFNEYTMIKPRQYGKYVGFTEEEVVDLCCKNRASFEQMKYWYDGYSFRDTDSVYNPNSVMKAIQNKDFDSYWTQTSAAESLMEYISKGYTGLTKTIAELVGGIDVKVDTLGFANDLVTFRNKDDVLTLMVHLGYLAYDEKTKSVHIPNEEIRREFSRSVREVDHAETIKRIQESDKLIYDTVHMNEDAVASQIEKIHTEETVPLHYNREASLRSVIKLAYYEYKDHYLQWEELPAGEGYADVVYLPKRISDYPALVIELKWNKSAEGAIAQILEKKYPDALKEYGGEILLVGVNYDKDAPVGSRKHRCIIQKV